MKNNHTETSALATLTRKQDVKIHKNNGLIEVLNNKAPNKHNDVGLKSWGKIDFLCNVLGYRYTFVSKFTA